MKVDKEMLQKVAHLARLHVREGEEEKLCQDLSEILTWVEKLKEVDTSNVEALTHMTSEINAMRSDEAIKTIARESALKNAPKKDDQFFKVPKVLK